MWEGWHWRCYAVVFMLGFVMSKTAEQSSHQFSLSHHPLFYRKVVWKSNSLFMTLVGEGAVGREPQSWLCVWEADKQLVQWVGDSLAAHEQLSWEFPLLGTRVNLSSNCLSQQDSGPLACQSGKPLGTLCSREQARKLYRGLALLFPCFRAYIEMFSPIKGSWAARSSSVPFS